MSHLPWPEVKPTIIKSLETALVDLLHQKGSAAESFIESHLKEALSGVDAGEQLAVLLELIQTFGKEYDPGEKTGTSPAPLALDDIMLDRVCSLLLGRNFSQEKLTAEELLEKLAKSLNMVFDALNQLINTINTTLAGNQNPDQTIRQVIGYHLDGDEDAVSLETHIGQISKAFLATQEAFKLAAKAKIQQIIKELSPEQIKLDAGVTRLTPMRRSKYYDAYKAKFAKFRSWVESDGFMESYLREVEKNCHKISL